MLKNKVFDKSVEIRNPIDYGIAVASYIISGANVWPHHKGYKEVPADADKDHYTYAWEDCGFLKYAGVLEQSVGDYSSPTDLLAQVRYNVESLKATIAMQHDSLNKLTVAGIALREDLLMRGEPDELDCTVVDVSDTIWRKFKEALDHAGSANVENVSTISDELKETKERLLALNKAVAYFGRNALLAEFIHKGSTGELKDPKVQEALSVLNREMDLTTSFILKDK